MNILLITPEYPPYGSGIANVCYMLRENMLKRGVNIHILSKRNKVINTAVSKFPGIASLIPFWQRAVDYAINYSDYYDIIWLHSPLLIDIRKLYWIKKLVITFHTTYYGFYEAFKKHAITYLLPYYFLASKLERKFLKGLSCNRNTVITAVSPSVAEELCKNGLTSVPFIIPNGININNYHSIFNKQYAKQLLQQWNLLHCSEKDCFLLVYVGRITEQKQPALLIQVFKRINSIIPNTHLIISGSGNLLSKIRKERSRNIHILGYIPREKLFILLNAADAFISLSCYEGLPLAVLEAALFKLPLILSDIPAHKWMLSSKIGYGILVNSRNPNVTKILNFLNDIEKGYFKSKIFPITSSIKQFSWENINQQYLTLFEKIN